MSRRVPPWTPGLIREAGVLGGAEERLVKTSGEKTPGLMEWTGKRRDGVRALCAERGSREGVSRAIECRWRLTGGAEVAQGHPGLKR